MQVISVGFDDVATGETVIRRIDFPAGATFRIISIEAYASAIASDPALTIGTTAAGTQIVASTNLTTNMGALTLKSNDVTAGDVFDIRLVADAVDDTAESVSISIFGYVSAPPTSEALSRGT
jgi:hypothetical protein